MDSEQAGTAPKAMVAVFEDKQTAVEAVKALHDAGFPNGKMELVTNDLREKSPDIETPKVRETTLSAMIESAEDWGGIGAGMGLAGGVLAAVLTGFPGVAIGMIVAGGVTGAIVGGMAGVDHANEDDSVNLPTIAEYEQLLSRGHKLVVVHGNHHEILRAKEVISHLPCIHNHLHPVHGHEFHEHPSRPSTD